jgi:Fungal Zn(2)-Cys(6) binuclear cluster domain
MPNTGRHSRNCHLCRQRRIKVCLCYATITSLIKFQCDLARPSCGQCLRLGKPCSGYRDEASMRFRIANMSSFPANTRRGHRKIRYHDAPVAKTESPVLSVQIVYEPPQVWSQHVIPLVLDKFSVALVEATSTGSDGGMFATIPRIIASTPQGSPVYAVSNAIACAYVASTTGSAAAVANRARAYGEALAAVNVALDDRAECQNDSTLLAIWMFVVYEVRMLDLLNA